MVYSSMLGPSAPSTAHLVMDIPSTSSSSSSILCSMSTLVFYHTDIRFVLLIPDSHFQLLESLKNVFLGVYLAAEELQGSLGLALKFLEFLTQQHVSPVTLSVVLRAFDSEFLGEDSEIHSLVTALTALPDEQQQWLGIYYRAIEASSGGEEPRKAQTGTRRLGAIFQHVKTENFQLMAVFGGQGDSSRTCVKELAGLYKAYRPMLRRLIGNIGPQLYKLSSQSVFNSFYKGTKLDLESWLMDPATTPDFDFISRAPISVPIIGALSLARYCVLCQIMGLTPGELRSLFQATTGHSQGLLASITIAISDSWDSFYQHCEYVIEILFYMGWECHSAAPCSAVAAADLDQVDGKSAPSYMFSVRGLKRNQMESFLRQVNASLPEGHQIYLSLINAEDQFVVAGPVASLLHLEYCLARVSSSGEDQSRTPFSSRKPSIQHCFIPVSAPFHTSYLTKAAESLKRRFQNCEILANQLILPVYHTRTGQNFCQWTGNILPIVIDAIVSECCDWPTALSGPGHMSSHHLATISHIVVLDSGGLGSLVKKVKEGWGVRVIQGGEMDSRDPEMGTIQDMLSPRLLDTSTRLQSWCQRFQPRLTMETPTRLETRLSRLLGAPPVMVAGMTPTTMHADFVAAIMNAGYHVELAGGGYHNASEMATAIHDVAHNIRPGRGITCNLIYANPRAMTWQIALLRRLSRNNTAIDGLTIGAGVPSLQVATEYIQTLGLRYIGFKPGSVTSIRQVVEIAKLHPEFPILLQWTGGRGGGHHSFEDFHDPILATYGLIRQHSNIYLVAGSGFGNGEGIYPYLTGSWSLPMGRPLMPFDGVLLGSRMMVAKEAHTSPAVRKVITGAPGLSDKDWEKTYLGSGGGVITVKSEMGEPIHKIATRGVLLWAEMDKTVFSLPREDRIAYLTKHRDSIICRLNADYAKPWFGRNLQGDVVNLEDMSYLDVLHRMIQLMYVHHQERWIDSTYPDLIMTLVNRWLERLPVVENNERNLSHVSLAEAPDYFLHSFMECCPTGSQDLLNPEDISFFLMECKKTGRKPVNFIPALNEDFELYFKKDSLWQSEDVEAVIGQDPERVCILHGPVAAQYSLEGNESAQDILDSVITTVIDCMQQDYSRDQFPSGLFSGQVTPASWSTVSSLEKDSVEDIPTSSATALSEPLDDHSIVSGVVSLGSAGRFPVWMRGIFQTKVLLQGRRRRENPFHRFFLSHPNAVTRFDADRSVIDVYEQYTTGATPSLRVSCPNGSHILVEIHPPRKSDPLRLLYDFDPNCSTFGLSEIMENRNARVISFYSKLWFGREIDPGLSVNDTFYGPQMNLTENLLDELTKVTGSAFSDHRCLVSDSPILPLSIGMIIAWEVISRPLVLNTIGGDLLQLVHLSNTFEYCDGASPLRLGDTVESRSRIQGVYMEGGGEVVSVEGLIIRSGTPVMLVASKFLLRDATYEDQSLPRFRRAKEPQWSVDVSTELEESIIMTREWFHPIDCTLSLVGKSIIFNIETYTRYREDGLKDIHVTGNAASPLQGIHNQPVGRVDFKSERCVGNPVVDFIKRKGRLLKPQIDFTTPGWAGLSEIEIQLPESNESYAELSKDFNPIHVCGTFASLAGIPGTICHGMFTSAIVERALEHLVLEGARERLHRYEAKFTAMVMPLERLVIKLKHTGMIDGRMRIAILVVRKGSDEVVLEAEAEVDQPPTAYLFTGQGSQSKGMGMELYRNSSVAKSLWDNIDQQLHDAYGWSVLEIVQDNPKSLTIPFGGNHGRAIRQKYLSITSEVLLPDGTREQRPVLPGLTPDSISYTFTNPRGLLYSTQFAQPAILLFEAATFAELRSKGYVSQGAMYAGHSLGEYGALSALSQYVPLSALVELAFYRGLVMQASVARADQGGSTYGMIATNPRRVGKYFGQAALGCLVRAIADNSQDLLEIVNFNVEGEQYVCSGTTTNLYVLGKLIDYITISAEGPGLVEELVKNAGVPTAKLHTMIGDIFDQAKTLPQPIQLERGKATIPLEGIDVPFHSSHLRGTVDKFRECLLRPGFLVDNIDLEQLVGRFIPNLMAKPFSLDAAYIKEAYEVTQSPILGEILGI